MAKKQKTDFDELLALAEQYNVADNPMFQIAAKQYATQQKVIDNINTILSDSEDLMVNKEYVKGRENVYSHPLVKELPKHSDSANRTAATILDIIKTFGKEPEKKGKLEEFMNE